MHAQIADDLLQAVFGQVTVSAVQLQGSVGDVETRVGGETFGHGTEFDLVGCVRVQRGRRELADVLRILTHAVRVPDLCYADYLAQAGALRVAERRLHELCERHGVETIKAFVDEWLAYGERMMAAAIARAELATSGWPTWDVASAGVSVDSPGAPISPQAVAALRELGIEAPEQHRARALTAQMCAGTEAVYCMTRAQREAVLALAPDAAGRTFCLDPDSDVDDPAGQALDAYRSCARRLQTLVRDRIRERRERYALSGVEGG